MTSANPNQLPKAPSSNAPSPRGLGLHHTHLGAGDIIQSIATSGLSEGGDHVPSVMSVMGAEMVCLVIVSPILISFLSNEETPVTRENQLKSF